MLSIDDIKEFCKKQNYKLQTKEKNKRRWIDQKLTADVLFIVSDCIFEYCAQNNTKSFKVRDIWKSNYANDNIIEIYKKPNLNDEKAKSEYDKFFLQPMELLAFSGILQKNKIGNTNVYKLINVEVLEYIALREINALKFLDVYIEKFLKDNEFWEAFETFIKDSNKTQTKYSLLKKQFETFQKNNTNIKSVRSEECNRIFAKVINILAFFRQSQGSKSGRLSKNIILAEDITYNRLNFRDKISKKPKGITRQEYEQFITSKEFARTKFYVTKAKKFLRLFNDKYRHSLSEYDFNNDKNCATEIHHIFPKSQYPEISDYIENLIALTPTQHRNGAHSLNRTMEIDETYQHLLLLAKTDRINENITNKNIETIYEFSKFLYVLNIGFDNDSFLKIADMDFNSIINAINLHYAA